MTAPTLAQELVETALEARGGDVSDEDCAFAAKVAVELAPMLSPSERSRLRADVVHLVKRVPPKLRPIEPLRRALRAELEADAPLRAVVDELAAHTAAALVPHAYVRERDE